MKALIVSDVHGNIEALRAIELAAGPVDTVIFLGDVTDYGPRPKECIAWLQVRASERLRGNHDNAVLEKVDCQCGQAFRKYSVATREYMWKILEPPDYEFIRGSSPDGNFELDGVKIYAAHAAPSDPLFKYLKPSTPVEEFEKEAEGIEDGVVLLGHTHFPMDIEAGGVRFVNPGSAGQPRDGDPRAAYAIWRDGDITLHRLEYDTESVCRDMSRLPLDREIIDGLTRVLRTGE